MSGSRIYRRNLKKRISQRKRRQLDKRDKAKALADENALEDRETLRVAKRRVEDAKIGMAIRKLHGI